MPSSVVTPVSQGRAARQGKIRWAIRGPKGFPVTLEHFRFTSPDELAIRKLAELYGGEVKPWDEPSAAERNQFEVITETNQINVWLVPGEMWKGYEHWQGGTCERRCDGETVEVPVSVQDGTEMRQESCLCAAAGALTCKPKVRFSVIIPEVPFGGVWQIDTSSWAAWHSIPDMAEMLAFMQGDNQQLEPARILLTDRSKKVRERGRVTTKRFKVIQLILPRSPQEIMSGVSGLAEVGVGSAGTKVLEAPQQDALGPGNAVPPPSEGDTTDAEIIDAEVVADSDNDTVFATVADAAKVGIQRSQLEKRSDGWHVVG